jgi:hypothetical protein
MAVPGPGLLADTSAPWVQDDVRYPVQPWILASTKPARANISRSDRFHTAPAIQSDHVPFRAASSGMTCGSRRMSAIWSPVVSRNSFTKI